MKEHVREPTALFWTLLSPALVFYGMSYSNSADIQLPQDYMELSKWYYAYVSLNVALFGFSYYLIGRRESGFIRSFVYTRTAQIKFLACHSMSYWMLAAGYCMAFYALTKPYVGAIDIAELTMILARYSICYLTFSAVGLLFTLPPLKFQTAGTLFSILSFAIVIGSLISERRFQELENINSMINPLKIAAHFVAYGQITLGTLTLLVIGIAFSTKLTIAFFRVNPVWSRY